MPDIYVMNDAISYTIVVFILGVGICVAFVSVIERVHRWMKK